MGPGETQHPGEASGAGSGRMATGIPGLDRVLGGGLLTRRTSLINGQPGSGKTVLAAQICFERARRGERCVFVTMLTESHGILLENLRGLTFYDERPMGRTITVISGYPAMENGGLGSLMRAIRVTVSQSQPSLLVLDALICPAGEGGSPEAFKRFLRELAALCSLLGCTALCISTPNAPDETAAAAHACDGVFELGRVGSGLRTERFVEVHKLRGSSHLTGRHLFEIGREGLAVYPRTEAVLGKEASGRGRGRLPFGIERLDRMLHGGLVDSSTTAVLGPAGSGKTLLGLHFLAEGARRGEPGLYFGFYESPDRLVAKAEATGAPLRQMVEAGTLELCWQPPHEHPLDALAEALISAVRRTRARRLMVEGVDAFAVTALYPERVPRFLAALTNELRSLGVVSLFSEETELFTSGLAIPTELSASFENLLLLRYEERDRHIRRLLSILKVRESDYDGVTRELRIGAGGIEIVEAQDDTPRPPEPRPRRRREPRTR